MIVDDVGLWCQIDRTRAAGAPALFLDRDGVIVADTRYLGRVEHIAMLAGAAAAVARCNALQIPVVLVTNQSGIARGYYDWNGFRAVQAAISRALSADGAHLDAVLACAYHADGRGPLQVPDHPWRKPNPGMFLEAGRRMALDLSRSWIVGDAASDLAAGKAAGLAGGTLLGADGQDRQSAHAHGGEGFIVAAAPDLAAAVTALIAQGRLHHAAQPAAAPPSSRHEGAG
jgi:D-glycero-D-manno-heptose 1,7-bisphosphate phosphatase